MALRENLKLICKHLSVRQREMLARSLCSLGGGPHGVVQETGEVEKKDLRLPRLGRARSVCSSAHCAQASSQVEVASAALSPAPGFQALGSAVRKGAGFSVISGFKPISPTDNAAVGELDAIGVAREMSNELSHQKMDETVRIYDEWVKSTDVAGIPKKPNVLVYNLLLHAKLRLGTHPDVLHQIVKEMENEGVTPTLLSYNFLLRSVFRQRDSKAAELILSKMERAGPEAQPDGDAYNFVIALCALNRRIPAALRHMQAMYERNLVPSKITYNEVRSCPPHPNSCCCNEAIGGGSSRTTILHPAHQMTPQIQTLVELVIAATEVDDAECALAALQYLNNQSIPRVAQPLVMDEGSIVAILGTAARTANFALAKEAWDLLKSSVGSARAHNPAACMALVHTLSTSQQFDAALSTLAEMQNQFKIPRNAEELEILSLFSSLRPFTLSLSQMGPTGLDGVSLTYLFSVMRDGCGGSLLLP
uniref:Pentatricopeptide repeat-containing protein-mitochondrial domain-containing protein n=1 Tax=Physcomitrium patens TaxID=3218 RepID=A0A2K1JIG6_PHYPA|nr:hypothetical protein PHYPA_018754 [Physcomitrium patens]